ncbi:hypothetical protein DPMN_151886 [Dreissena polymorpha]|uniref:Uncharacterized protein n=1 Tax=Dreissena polymorpha TaxID=45954 RepID=A0A9D4J6X7_DREPO|nr:hypothetical protein DPMN_151886 [Dreissena polymorpha]
MDFEEATFNISSSLAMKIHSDGDYCVPTITLCGTSKTNIIASKVETTYERLKVNSSGN